ncbi:hypothetical protein APHAL10511_000775 [Amanita phalloides]|nr:hypothetical protein APHAL10511_000775 [Amanita phalloides]
MDFNSIIVNDSGIQIAYTDSGAPSASPYITIVAIHGMCFSSPIFKRVQAAAPKKGARFVATNRRNYPGSTPFSEAEINVLINGTKEQKDAFNQDRGHEIAMFIQKLIEKENIPPITADGKSGGVAVLGWSLGTGYADATIAYADTLPSDVRSHLSKYIRSLTIQEPHEVMFGTMPEPPFYTPLIDTHIPETDRYAMFAHWISCYFQHGDITTKDPKVLSRTVPASVRPSSLCNMSMDEQKETICTGAEPAYELPYMINFLEQFGDTYHKSFFGDGTRALFPNFRASFIVGEFSPAFGISTYWKVEKDAKEAGKPVNLKIIPNGNHFGHWDDPEETMDVYLECA